jgi:cytochrome c553
MKSAGGIGMVAISLVCLLLAATTLHAADKKKSMLARGEYLVTLGSCNDCHSPKNMTPQGPVPNKALLLSGHPADEKLPASPMDIIGPDKWGTVANNNFTAWVGPWGISYAVNLTPDRETGIGTWNEELFIRILRTGKFMGSGRDILPPMPWPNLAKLSDRDLKAMFAYLKSIKPVRNQVPQPVIAAPPK